MIDGDCNGAVFWGAIDIGINPAPIVVDVVVDVGDRKLGFSGSEAFAVSNGEGEVDVADEVF